MLQSRRDTVCCTNDSESWIQPPFITAPLLLRCRISEKLSQFLFKPAEEREIACQFSCAGEFARAVLPLTWDFTPLWWKAPPTCKRTTKTEPCFCGKWSRTRLFKSRFWRTKSNKKSSGYQRKTSRWSTKLLSKSWGVEIRPLTSDKERYRSETSSRRTLAVWTLK